MTILVGLLHPVVAKWPRADWAVVSACVRRVLVSDASPVLLWYSRGCPLFDCRRFRAVGARAKERECHVWCIVGCCE